MMETKGFDKLFAPDVLKQLFPEDRSDQFFDANRLEFMLRLTQRPGKCITCSLTYGLPEVFTRHPIINIKGLVQNIEALLDGRGRCVIIPLGIALKS